jgi:hypothetical protein
MILNTYLKIKNVSLTKNQKSWLGKNIIRCFISKYPNAEIKKVSILENDCKMEVIDYPKEFLQSDSVNKIINRFLKKNVLKLIITKY